MAQTSTFLASLDEKLTIERLRLERVLFRFVVARLARSEVGGGFADRLMVRLEAEVNCGGGERITDSDVTVPTLEDIERLAASAPEPYRTMLASHLQRFERINDELLSGTMTIENADPLDQLAGEIGYRAARGALAGSIAPELASFVRKHRLTAPPA